MPTQAENCPGNQPAKNPSPGTMPDPRFRIGFQDRLDPTAYFVGAQNGFGTASGLVLLHQTPDLFSQSLKIAGN